MTAATAQLAPGLELSYAAFDDRLVVSTTSASELAVALAPLALAAAVSGDAGNAVRAGLAVWAVALVATVCADADVRPPRLTWRGRADERSTGVARRHEGIVAVRAGDAEETALELGAEQRAEFQSFDHLVPCS